MQTLIAIAGFIGLVFLWWSRFKTAKSVATKVGGVLGHMQYTRESKKAGLASLGEIKSPVVAAATIIVSLQSEEFVLGEGDEEIIETLLLRISSREEVSEAMIYAKWAVLQGVSANEIVARLGGFLKSQLDDEEKIWFLELLDEANNAIGGCYDFANSRARLAQSMGLEIAR